MEVILQEKIRKLGGLGEKVKVKPGYARNYLIPQGKALPATDKNLAVFETKRKALEEKAEAKFNEANERKSLLEDKVIRIAMRTKDEGRLYGSVGIVEIANALETQAKIKVLKQEVEMPEGPIRETGEFTVGLHLHPDVSAELRIEIIPEEA